MRRSRMGKRTTSSPPTARCAIAATVTLAISLLLTWMLANDDLDQKPKRSSSAHNDDDNSLEPKKKLNFRLQKSDDDEEGHIWSFKILQLADIHLGEGESDWWGPEQDRNSSRSIHTLLPMERPIDLIILSGDQITGNNIDRNATTYYKFLISTIQDSYPEVKWAMIFGNHDDMPLETFDVNGTKRTTTPPKTTRKDLIKLDMSYENSYTKMGPKDVFGTSNYVLPLYREKYGNGEEDEEEEEEQHVVNIYLFDTGGGSLEQRFDISQKRWFEDISSNYPYDLPSIAFQHIPTSFDEFGYKEDKCLGFNGDGGVGPLTSDAGVVNMLNDHGNVHFLAVGHNHGNDYCCQHGQEGGALHLCFGRHSGYGGYGNWERGSRIYELQLTEERRSSRHEDASTATPNNKMTFSWQSYVRLESGEIVDEYKPVDTTSKDDKDETEKGSDGDVGRQ